MRGSDQRSGELFSYVDIEARVLQLLRRATKPGEQSPREASNPSCRRGAHSIFINHRKADRAGSNELLHACFLSSRGATHERLPADQYGVGTQRQHAHRLTAE